MNIEPYLEKHKNALISELSEFIQKPLPEEVRCVEVMVFRESMPGIPFRVFFLNRFKDTAKTIESFEPLSSVGVLVDSPDYISREEAICKCLDMDEEPEQDLCMDFVTEKYNSENQRLCQWFSECWDEAGGKNYQYHAFVVEEDGQFNPLNLKTGTHIKHMHEYVKVFDG
ncbi:MAG TPA: hypothetical protein PLO83_11120 [Gammaproteobacteria bacterium]|nr:hypothetical protein [Xanthomonadales bacterium]HOP23475.1 hypothetical protein [Gammaproteobacteria bacterium]